LLFLLLLLLGVNLTHLLGKLLHEVGAGAMSRIELLLIATSAALGHQLLLLDEHGSLRVLAL
jgi:hypothetical protein